MSATPERAGRARAGSLGGWAPLAAALAVSVAILSACGGTTAPAPSTGTTSVAGSSASAPAGNTGNVNTANGGQYAQYYTPKGTAVTLSAGKAQAVQVGNFFFDPNTLTVSPGAQVVLHLTNTTSTPHNFSLDAAHISVAIPANGAATATFTAPAKGTYYFYCNVPGHAPAGMVGKLTVQ